MADSSEPRQAGADAPERLVRSVGVFGATMMGLGSIIGTGIFVSIGIATGSAGPAVILAVVVAACVASFNGMSSAQLAAAHPVSGGTYEYGYRWLHPSLGFLAGWMFVSAKSASAATAALGFSGYTARLVGLTDGGSLVWLGLAIVLLVTILVLSGVKQSNHVNTALVTITIGSLLLFVVAGLPTLQDGAGKNLLPFFAPVNDSPAARGWLEACALMFVAYTGYGRIATLGEEIHDPRRNIPKAIVTTLVVAMLLYIAVGLVAVGTLGAERLFEATKSQAAPLEVAALAFEMPAVPVVIALGAATAMVGVLLNLILGLSRVVLAMGRRRDIPTLFSRLNASGTAPVAAVVLVATMIGGLVLVGDVKTTWSFSAFTVLVYYALTNVCALRMQSHERLYPQWLAWAGLVSCLFLAFWVEPHIWILGLALCASGLIWSWVASFLRNRRKHLDANP